MPQFSIITCTLNSLPYLEESIASVLAQDSDDYEYIFVDGGSTDGTLERIASIPRPATVLLNVGGGISAAMNAGVRAASGEIVCHLHSDDFFVRPDVLSLAAASFRTSGNKWGFGRSMPVKCGQLKHENYVAPTYSLAALERGNFIPHPSTFVARELFARVGLFDESLHYAMDYDLWLRLAKLEPPFTLQTPLAAMREHPGSASTRNRVDAVREDYRVRLRHVHGGILQRMLHALRFRVRVRKAMMEVGA